MTRPLLKLAKQGDAIAIAALMNAVLASQNIRVKARVERGCLQVMLKSAGRLHQHATIAFIRRGMLNLQPETIHAVRAYAWHLGREFPDWVAEFSIAPLVESGASVTRPPISPLKLADTQQPTLLQPALAAEPTAPTPLPTIAVSAAAVSAKPGSNEQAPVPVKPARPSALFKVGFVVILGAVACWVVIGV